MRLLLIEDDALLRSTLQSDLERAGYAVDCAADGEQGEFLGSTEHYDIVVLDLGLPRLSGLDVLRRWRASGVTVPVIILTARDEWHERVEGLKAGADGESEHRQDSAKKGEVIHALEKVEPGLEDADGEARLRL